MSQEELSLLVSVYLRGDDLHPDEITRRVGFEPTDARRKGETWTTSTNHQIVAKTGRWSWSRSIETDDVAGVLAEFLLMFPADVSLGELPGVTEAYFDIFVIVEYDESGCGEGAFVLDPQCLRRLADSGLPLQVTMAASRAESQEQ